MREFFICNSKALLGDWSLVPLMRFYQLWWLLTNWVLSSSAARSLSNLSVIGILQNRTSCFQNLIWRERSKHGRKYLPKPRASPIKVCGKLEKRKKMNLEFKKMHPFWTVLISTSICFTFITEHVYFLTLSLFLRGSVAWKMKCTGNSTESSLMLKELFDSILLKKNSAFCLNMFLLSSYSNEIDN